MKRRFVIYKNTVLEVIHSPYAAACQACFFHNRCALSEPMEERVGHACTDDDTHYVKVGKLLK